MWPSKFCLFFSCPFLLFSNVAGPNYASISLFSDCFDLLLGRHYIASSS